jgi:hypothetical protein
MLGRLGAALALICLLASGAARAGPLTFYANPPVPAAENDWLTAISGSTIWSPYPYDVTIIDRSISVRLYPDRNCCIISNPVTTITVGPLPSIITAVFSELQLDSDSGITVNTDVSIIFPTFIYGFASLSPGGVFENRELYINGQAAPFIQEVFFGIVGYTDVLDFRCDDSCYTTDESNNINFGDLVVATKVDEPSGAALLAIALYLMALTGLGYRPDGRVKLSRTRKRRGSVNWRSRRTGSGWDKCAR